MRASLVWVGLCAALACGEPSAPQSAATRPRTRDLLGDTYDVVALSQYRLIPPRTQPSLAAGNLPPELRLLGGLRLLGSGGEAQKAQMLAEPGLLGARQVPSVAGGGFLFWNRDGVYRSRTFLGPLEPVQALPFEVGRVAFGPGYVLLRGMDGGTRVIDWYTGKWRSPAPLGLVNVVAAEDGRVASELVFQRFIWSADRNATTHELEPQLAARVRSLSHEPLGFVLDDGSLLEVSLRGELLSVARPPLAPDAHALPGGESPLERAVTFGVPRGDDRAVFAHGSALVEVDLRSGQTRRRSSQLLPGHQSCELAEVGREQLLFCEGSSAVSVFGNVNRDGPLLERTFARAAKVTTGFGRVLVDHDCGGKKVALSVCLREVGGSWRELRPPQLRAEERGGGGGSGGGEATTERVEVQGYALKEEGGAVAFIRSGKELAYRDLVSGEVTALSGSEPLHPSGDTRCRVYRSREVRCLGPQGPFSFGADGGRRVSPFPFRWVAQAGERALGGDGAGKFFQSLDFGREWMEVEPPPSFEPRDRPTRCSAIGCRVGGWLRLGWEATSPARREARPAVALPPRLRPDLPKLSCTEIEPARVRGGGERPGAFGAEMPPPGQLTSSIAVSASTRLAEDDVSLRGVLRWSEPPTTLHFRYLEFLDPEPVPHVSSLAIGEWHRLLRGAGAPLPSLEREERATIPAVPVLGSDGKAAGLVLTLDESPVWLKLGRAQPLTLELDHDAGVITSAVAQARGGIAVLLDSGEVVRHPPTADPGLLRVPGATPASASPDALAVSAQGELVVIRFDASEPPSADYPAWAYRHARAPEALAPWSSLTPAGHASCQGRDGYRAIVALRQSWLALGPSAPAVEDDVPLLASVRWSKERVCLEAVEAPQRTFELPENSLPTRVVASFGSKPLALRLGTSAGAELRQALRCALER